jgi:pyruvate/2-oxoglutarate dehydrogenase complex dihydrolipoamide dehydrogenase (E3) component
MMQVEDVDVVVIGAGGGGYPSCSTGRDDGW